MQAVLVVGTLEWLGTAWALAAHRMTTGQPYARMLAILGAVAVLTAIAAWMAGNREPARTVDRAV